MYLSRCPFCARFTARLVRKDGLIRMHRVRIYRYQNKDPVCPASLRTPEEVQIMLDRCPWILELAEALFRAEQQARELRERYDAAVRDVATGGQ